MHSSSTVCIGCLPSDYIYPVCCFGLYVLDSLIAWQSIQRFSGVLSEISAGVYRSLPVVSPQHRSLMAPSMHDNLSLAIGLPNFVS